MRKKDQTPRFYKMEGNYFIAKMFGFRGYYFLVSDGLTDIDKIAYEDKEEDTAFKTILLKNLDVICAAKGYNPSQIALLESLGFVPGHETINGQKFLTLQ